MTAREELQARARAYAAARTADDMRAALAKHNPGEAGYINAANSAVVHAYLAGALQAIIPALLDGAVEDYDRGYSHGHDDGYREGHADGREQAGNEHEHTNA